MNAVHENHFRHRRLNTVATALAFILVGIFFLFRNFGWITQEVFSVVVSWQMLLIYIGVVSLLKKNIIGGLISITVGSYFLLPSAYGLHEYWPVLLIVIGVSLLFKLNKKNGGWGHKNKSLMESTATENGYVTSDVSFGGAKHIVLDPVFRGGSLDASFGSITLDLRRTTLEASETYIQLDCSFAGIELFIPSHWNVILKTDNSFGAVDDKRFHSHEIDYDHKLIIQGSVSFGGVEIKS